MVRKVVFFTFTATGGYYDENWEWHDTGFKIPGIKSTKAQKLKVYVDDVKLDTEYDLVADTETSITIPDIDSTQHQVKIELKKIEALTELTFSGTSISALDISNCIALTYLNCSFTLIQSLDVSNCTALTELILEFDTSTNRTFSSLNISNCTALTELDCSYSNISSLDVSKCTKISYIYIADTPMASNPNQPTGVPPGCEVVRRYV